MFGKSGKKSKRVSKTAPSKAVNPIGVLTAQKPIRSRKKNLWKYGLAAALVVTLVGTILLTKDRRAKPLTKTSRRSDIEISLHPSTRDNDAISQTTKSEIIASAGLTLSDLTPLALERVARALQARFLAEDVRVVRVAKNRVYIMLTPRQSAMRIKADEMRLLSGGGQIYGSAKDSDSALPLLSGIFDGHKETLSMRDNQTLQITEEQRTLVQEALTILTYTKERQLADTFDEVHYIKHRGFTLRASKDGLEVAIGRAPFDRKMTSLDNILAGLRKRGSQAQRIELDYDGKAFVKEKRL